jgi:hypothetical protein
VKWEEALKAAEGIKPPAQLSQALGFVRLVFENNPAKSQADILKRPDVQQALAVIVEWVEKTKETVGHLADEAPEHLAEHVAKVIEQSNTTLDKYVAETKPSQLQKKQVGLSPKEYDAWAAQFALRVNWFSEFIRAAVEAFRLSAPFKRWVSKLTDVTCKYCKALHGTVVPVGASFAPAAVAAGYPAKWVYAGLYGPRLHPHCQCTLQGVQKKTDTL